MSTFVSPADIDPITLAKSSDINAIKTATATAFALLPTEAKLKQGTVNFAVDTGTANAYVAALDATVVSYTDGLSVVLKPLNSNTGAATINVNSMGAKSIRLTGGEALAASDLAAGAPIELRYSTTSGFFHISSNSANAAAVAAAQAVIATAQAGIATTGGNTATTQAGISTVQAGISTVNAAATAADLLLTNTDVVLTHADAIATAADALATAADRVQTGLDAIATAADRVQTGIDASTATTQAGLAATAKTAAEAALDSFDDRYLGSKAADPTLDNDGNALLTGALYWNSVAGQMRVYDGAAWQITYLPSATYVAGPASAVNSNVALFDGITGKIIKDSGLTLSGSNTGDQTPTSLGLLIGTNVQAYDVDTAKLDVAQAWTAQQTFKELKDTVYTITDGAAFEIDPANGSVQTVTLGASRTPAATNFEAGQTVVLGIDDGTAYSVTWTTVNPTWTKVGGSGAAPTLAATGKTWIVLWKVGTTMYCSHLGDG